MQIAVEFDKGTERHLAAQASGLAVVAELTVEEPLQIVATRLETDDGRVLARKVRSKHRGLFIEPGDNFELGFQL